MGQRCARAGCRAWAMRGATYCRSHRRAADDGADEGPDGRAARADAFNALARRGAGGDLVEQAVRGIVAATAGDAPLAGEIRSLRLILSRVVALDALEGEPREVAQTATKLVDTIVRAVRAQHGLSGGDAGALMAVVEALLAEQGMGAEP